MINKTGAVATAVLLWAGAASLAAQPATAQSADDAVLGEVVVTAERRVENLQDVPISATVLNADALADLGVDNVNELQQVSPSLAINTYNRSTFINIRGVGIAQSAPTSSPGVAFYIDGAFVPHEQTIGQSFYDLAAVEVLRGPQGTLTGQNSTGGAVYVRTPDPVIGQWGGMIDQTFGDFRQWRTVGAVNVPLGSTAALRLAGTVDQRDSFTRNIGSSPSHPGDGNFKGYRVSLAMQPGEKLRIKLHYEHYFNSTDHNAVKNRADLVSSDPFVIEEDAVSKFLQRGYRSSAEMLYDLTPSIRLRWLSNYQYGFTEDISDGDRTTTAPPRPPNANVGRLGYARTTINTLAHEVNLLSSSEGPFSWIVGAFYLNENIPLTLLRYNLSTVVANTAPTSTIITVARNDSKSGFGQLSYSFSPQWQAIIGARYSRDQQDYNRIASPGGTGIGTQKSDQTTGRAALNWKPAADTLVYLSYSRGYKAGGVNLGAADPNYLPERNQVTELGLKKTLLQGHLRINADAFHSDYKDVQLASLAGTPPAPVTQNAAAGRSHGAEIELQAVIGGLSFNMGYAFLNAEFAQSSTLQNAVTNLNQLVPAGADLPFSPAKTANAGLQYRVPLSHGTLTPRVQYSYVDSQYATPFPSTVTFVPSHGIVDARLTWEPTESWRIEAAVTNVADKTYVASQIQNSSSADGGILYGAPRQVALRVSRKFE